jgi:glycosyltransferase involved in cell wall biosynthesis
MVPKFPLPAEDGARVATVAQLRAVVAAGASVHLVAFAREDEPCDAAAARAQLGVDVTVLRMPAPSPRRLARAVRAMAVAPTLPITIAPYAAGDLRAAAGEVLDAELRRGGEVTLVIDGLHAAGPFARRGAVRRPDGIARLVYRAHNVEADLWLQAARRSGAVTGTALSIEALRVAAFERSLVTAASHVATVAEEDALRFRSLNPGVSAACAPIRMRFADRLPAPSRGPRRLLYVGRLDWDPNRSGLEWFLREVWSEVVARAPDLTLSVAGSGDGSWLAPYASLPNLTLLGRAPELDPLYRQATCAIVPIFYGSGTRVKVLEAASHGRACVSTAAGAAGSGLQPGDGYLRAESREDWIETLASLDPRRVNAVAERAWRVGKARFSTANGAALASLFGERVRDERERELELVLQGRTA